LRAKQLGKAFLTFVNFSTSFVAYKSGHFSQSSVARDAIGVVGEHVPLVPLFFQCVYLRGDQVMHPAYIVGLSAFNLGGLLGTLVPLHLASKCKCSSAVRAFGITQN
jgi:hypothetical protein